MNASWTNELAGLAYANEIVIILLYEHTRQGFGCFALPEVWVDIKAFQNCIKHGENSFSKDEKDKLTSK